ncbi:hypothetical protein GQ457_06G012610 [Hibiscus cannabinus]
MYDYNHLMIGLWAYSNRYQYSGTSIGTALEISLVSIHGKEYQYPSSLMELEYRSLTLWRQEGKEDQGITYVQVRFCGYGSILVFCIFGLEYRYSSVVSVPEFNTGIRVSVLLDEYRYPFEIM